MPAMEALEENGARLICRAGLLFVICNLVLFAFAAPNAVAHSNHGNFVGGLALENLFLDDVSPFLGIEVLGAHGCQLVRGEFALFETVGEADVGDVGISLEIGVDAPGFGKVDLTERLTLPIQRHPILTRVVQRRIVDTNFNIFCLNLWKS